MQEAEYEANCAMIAMVDIIAPYQARTATREKPVTDTSSPSGTFTPQSSDRLGSRANRRCHNRAEPCADRRAAMVAATGTGRAEGREGYQASATRYGRRSRTWPLARNDFARNAE